MQERAAFVASARIKGKIGHGGQTYGYTVCKKCVYPILVLAVPIGDKTSGDEKYKLTAENTNEE